MENHGIVFEFMWEPYVYSLLCFCIVSYLGCIFVGVPGTVYGKGNLDKESLAFGSGGGGATATGRLNNHNIQ